MRPRPRAQAPVRSLLVSGEHPRRQDLVPAPARQAARARRLERVRGGRRRPDGRAAVVRPARGPHPAERSRSSTSSKKLIWYIPDILQIAHERHAPGAGGERPRPDPARDRRRAAHRVDGGFARRSRRGSCACAPPAQHFRDRAHGAAVDRTRRSSSAEQLVQRPRRGGRHRDRPGLRDDRAQLCAAIPERLEPARARARSAEAHGRPRRQGRHGQHRAATTSSSRSRSSRACRSRSSTTRSASTSRLVRGYFTEPRHRPGRGGRRHRRAHRHAQGRPQRSAASRSACSCSPARPAPARRSSPRRLPSILFGSLDRMIRLDMSEFQTPESTAKILGSSEAAQPTDSLISACASSRSRWCCSTSSRRRTPTIWDLFLQVFDDGRLTDAAGPGRRFPPLHHHPDDQPRRHQPPHRAASASRPRPTPSPASRSSRAIGADLPARVPEPARQGHRVPPADARADARRS